MTDGLRGLGDGLHSCIRMNGGIPRHSWESKVEETRGLHYGDCFIKENGSYMIREAALANKLVVYMKGRSQILSTIHM